MKKVLVIPLVLLFAGCEWKSYEVKESHELIGWIQTDLGGGVYSAVSAEWSVTNKGDMSFWSQLGVHVAAADGEEYIAGTPMQRVQPGQTLSGTLVVDTATAQALGVTLVKYRPDVTDPW